MKRLVVLTLVVLALSACAGPRTPTRSELLEIRKAADATRTRIYSASPERVLSAAARVLEESDSDYKPMGQTETSTSYRRAWMLYLVLSVAMGEDNWKITATPITEGTRVDVAHWIGPQGAGIIPIMTGGGGESDYTLHGELYTLFHERLAYMLGDRDDWVSCKAAMANVNSDVKSQEPLHALCAFTTDKDVVPR